MSHISVLLQPSIEALNVKEDGFYVDGTLGRGGHTEAIAKQLTTGKVLVFDLDEEAIALSKERLEPYKDRIIYVHDNYATIKTHVLQHFPEGLDGFIFDLGVSSPQFDEGGRGFSYRFDAPLDMRMDTRQSFNAQVLINTYSLQEITDVLRNYGEEPFAYPIAKKIVAAREVAPIETTFQLVDIIKSALPTRILSKKGHPAKQSFQALRMEVNQELQSVKTAIADGCELLKPSGIGCVITFHSLEDRIVKDIFKQLSSAPKTNKRLPMEEVAVDFTLITRKPITASQEELEENPRAHSAKLRVIQRKGD